MLGDSPGTFELAEITQLELMPPDKSLLKETVEPISDHASIIMRKLGKQLKSLTRALLQLLSEQTGVEKLRYAYYSHMNTQEEDS